MSAQTASLRGAIKAADDDLGDWLKGLVTGEGSTPSQIIVAGLLSVIPGLGQAMDLRDIVLGVIVIAKTPASPMAWLDISITLVGCIPVMGDGLKTGFRLLKGGASLPRILDAASPALRGNLEKWFRNLDWGQIAASVKKNFDEVLGAFIDGLDSWLVKTTMGRNEVDFLIAQMKDLRARAPRMLGEAITELKAMWTKAMGDGLPKSTAAQTAPHPPPVPAPTRGRAEVGAKPATKRKPEPVQRDQSAKVKTTPDKARTEQRRAAKKKQKWETGVPAEHIADYWAARNKRTLRKANNGGRLWEEWDRAGRQGIDHLWMNPGQHVKPGVVAETKSTLFGAFRFLAALPADIRSQLNALGDAEAATPTAGGQPNIFESEARDGVESRTKVDATAESEAQLKRGLGKENPETGLKTQMSHAWIQEAIERENLTAAGNELRKLISRYEKQMAVGKEIKPRYARWIVMVTRRQKHLHEKKQGHRHEIQKPLILLPDSILEK